MSGDSVRAGGRVELVEGLGRLDELADGGRQLAVERARWISRSLPERLRAPLKRSARTLLDRLPLARRR